ncbi:coxsackievirus and adenovirus receptor homolog isoform X2 [Myripristis murdjan]|uniref:coxsackievirus and adenovirus receptor homolog isoform X2 n=1 Tax=Myripristis murdjan TaxID=586833 RepID=UPI0011761DB2|nr:coxsackievirus and adenovirus receptor homolog isoform X2 [Myripristis murdjan]
MISILLLVVLTASVCASLSVKVRQISYQAEENSNVMMEWIFRPNLTLTVLNIYCAFWLSDDRTSRTLYHLQDGVEHPESQHEQFAGRVHFDQNDFRNGLIRLHLSRLRSNDSGIYQCQVFSGENEGGSECLLNVTAARTQSTAEKTKPSSLGMICLLVGSGLLLESISLFCAPLCMDTFLLNESPPSGKMSSPQSEPPSADQGRLDPLQHLCSD